MAKIIKYNVLVVANYGTEEYPKVVESLRAVSIDWNEKNEEIAKKEAYNGEYEIIDGGQPEPDAQATTDDVLNALLGVAE